MKWFVMIRVHTRPMPMVDDNDNVVLFDNEINAIAAAERNPYGKAFGFEVYEWPAS